MKLLNLIKTAILGLVLSSTLLAQDATPPAAKPIGPTVQLSLIVTDSKNKSVDTVSKDEVRVVEDQAEQTVLSVEPDARHLDLGIAIDASGSVRRFLGALFEGAKRIVVGRRPNDEIFLERFVSTDKITKLQDFTSDEKVLTKALDSLFVEGGQSAVVDAVYIATQYVADHNRNSDRRKALVLFTDGEDRLSYYSLEKLLKLLHEKRVQVFVVGLIFDLKDEPTSATRPGNRTKAEKLLKTLAEETGGRAFFPNDPSEIGDSTAQIVHDLRTQFRITYQSTNGDNKAFRKVDVTLNSATGEKRRVIVPRGYGSPK